MTDPTHTSPGNASMYGGTCAGRAVYDFQPTREILMSPRKKRSSKKASRAKKPARKAASTSRSRKKTTKASSSKRRTRKTSKRAIAGLGTVRKVGERTWKTLKSGTARVVEGVKDTLGA